MTELRKDLNKLLKEKKIAEILEYPMPLRDTIRAISQRLDLEEDVFWAVKNDKFTLGDMTDEDLQKKIKNTDTSKLWDYMNWKRGEAE